MNFFEFFWKVNKIITVTSATKSFALVHLKHYPPPLPYTKIPSVAYLETWPGEGGREGVGQKHEVNRGHKSGGHRFFWNYLTGAENTVPLPLLPRIHLSCGHRQCATIGA